MLDELIALRDRLGPLADRHRAARRRQIAHIADWDPGMTPRQVRTFAFHAWRVVGRYGPDAGTRLQPFDLSGVAIEDQRLIAMLRHGVAKHQVGPDTTTIRHALDEMTGSGDAGYGYTGDPSYHDDDGLQPA